MWGGGWGADCGARNGRDAGYDQHGKFVRCASEELDVVIAEVSADQQPLGNVLEFLADTTHLNMAVNWQALEGGGGQECAGDGEAKSVPLHKVLDVILSQVREDLGYEFSGQCVDDFSR